MYKLVVLCYLNCVQTTAAITDEIDELINAVMHACWCMCVVCTQWQQTMSVSVCWSDGQRKETTNCVCILHIYIYKQSMCVIMPA